MKLSGHKYHCVAGEMFDSVAKKLYGDERYAAELLCANVTQADKMVFSGGEILEIPVVDITSDAGTDTEVTAPWKR